MGSIVGYVRDDLTYSPIDGACVSKNQNFNNYKQTGTNGYYQISVPPGTYTLYAEKDNLIPPPAAMPPPPYYYSTQTDPIAVNSDAPVSVDIFMRRKA